MRRLLLCLMLSACASGSNAPTTISAAIAGVQADLTKVGVVSASGVRDWSALQAQAFDRNVQAFQCAQRTPDPVVAMIAGPVTMALSGSFTQSGSFSVSASSALPVFGLQAEASRTHQQQLTLPVQFVPLDALADAEMARQVAYAGALLGQSDALRLREGQRITDDREALAAHVRLLVRGYDASFCAAGSAGRAFVGGHHGA